MSTISETAQQAGACFLCPLDASARSCAVPRLEGRLLAAWEQATGSAASSRAGERLPYLLLKTAEGLVSLQLTRDYRRLVQELRARGRSARGLLLRVYHLPEPAQPAEQQGRPVLSYRAGPWTLVVVEPDTLLNITDLLYAEYCPRQYLLQRLLPSGATLETLRGTLVHTCFKELLKAFDRGLLAAEEGQALALLRQQLRRALERSRLELALLNIAPAQLEAEVMPHLESLASWFEQQRTTLWDAPVPVEGVLSSSGATEHSEHLVRAETFLLAPEIGLKGRLDVLWQQGGRRRLLELKTGGASGPLPRRNHRWQVHGYHALLTVRRQARTQKALATLLYSGTPGEAQAFGIPFSIRELQQVNEQRNLLVISHVTGEPCAPPGPARCAKCALLEECRLVSWLLAWEPPALASEGEASAASDESAPPPLASSLTEYDRAFFAHYYRLLHSEGRASEQEQALLWRAPVAEHVARGMAIAGLMPLEPPQPTAQGEWVQRFRCENRSELRSGDEILLCDGHPLDGEVVTGTILEIGAREVTVWTPELITNPTLIERHATDVVHVRTLQNLWRWLQVEPRLRELVYGQRRPRFSREPVAPRADFNREQNLAVERALQMQDYLLIHGPPGTGKTAVIAEIVKRLCQRGERVLLAAFTNQAVDNMLLRLETEGFHDYLRLGHERSVAEGVQDHLLKHLAPLSSEPPESETATVPTLETAELRAALRTLPVVASTTATWSSERYTPEEGQEDGSGPLLRFDVALIDEAGQLTVPALLGALRFARRFILVGDEKQLPPLVLSREAAAAGLRESLFSLLKRRDEEYVAAHPGAESACVALTTQYRMHEQIAAFPSRFFYGGELRPHPSVARRQLALRTPSVPPLGERPAVLQALRPAQPLVFLDVTTPESEARVSQAEARLVRELVTALLARGVGPSQIGIIAPYRAQVANLRRHLVWKQYGAPHPALTIDTVDRFQGGERTVIIISFATTQAPSPDSLLYEFLTDAHRLNVALTRAQRKLILVGHAAALERLPILGDLLRYCREREAFISTE
ncbi:AAA domain-containing protein [Thermogemmatispora sp.]|uniref:AAA domain-containing protein n=1 Tax=Thermogemmatispora sp. TaxID=1968838 RepID=UPI001DD40760|nr:AAA domain-containing protein [Thermogemmatispora sp.]MBX5450181.1 AAA family ATPase [Thermogemmatispora sp.]